MKADEWIPVTERIPADGSDILVYCDDGEESRIVACNYDNGVWFDCVFNTVMVFKNITHWMSLPKPPKEDSEAMKMDKEKVIKGFGHCKIGKCVGCPYDQIREESLHGKHDKWELVCNEQLTEDILALLKEQEPILLENQHKPYGISTNANSPWISRCPRCGKKIEGKQTRFCKYCGQAVKWNS